MQSNHDYWQSVYATSRVPTFPSQFSIFVQSWLNATDAHVVEVGCGNGRDSRFFHSLGHRVTVTDQVICDDLRAHAQMRHGFAAVESKVDKVVASLGESIDFDEPLVLYSRFFQHAITASDQQIMLRSLSRVLHKDSLMFFEFRLDGDADSHKEFGTTHFRRFQSADEFRATLAECGFECVYSCEGHGYARYKSEDPIVGRFVAKPAEAAPLRLVSTSARSGEEGAPVSGIRIDPANNWLHGTSARVREGLVDLKVDGLLFTRVPLVASGEQAGAGFIFRPCVSLTDALPAHYRLSATLPDGEVIEHPDDAPLGAGDGSLRARLEEGHLVSAKAGYLFKPPSVDADWRDGIMKAYDATRAVMADIEGASDVFIAYGVLLGQVRSGDFIAHDDDFDAAFLIDAETPIEAAVALHRIMGELRAKGVGVQHTSHLGNFHLHFPGLPSIDVFMMYYRGATGELCSYNLAVECKRDIVLPMRTVTLAGHEVLAPRDSEALLEAIYGAGWATPDPYFQWNMTARHDMLKHAFMSASQAIEAGEPLPTFEDEVSAQEPTSSQASRDG